MRTKQVGVTICTPRIIQVQSLQQAKWSKAKNSVCHQNGVVHNQQGQDKQQALCCLMSE